MACQLSVFEELEVCYDVCVVFELDFPTTSIKSRIDHYSLDLFQSQNTIPKFTENSKRNLTSVCQGDIQSTEYDKEKPASEETQQTSVRERAEAKS